MNEVIREFLLETHENLAQLDSDLITLEDDPTERETLARVFRTLHSIKGTAGFVGLAKLESVAHAAESLLSRLRAGDFRFNRPIATAMLGVVDAIRQILGSIESNGDEGTGDYHTLIAKLERYRTTGGIEDVEPSATVSNQSTIRAAPKSNLSTISPPKTASNLSTIGTPSQFTGKPTNATVELNKHEEAPPTEVAEPRTSSVADSTIRVDVGLLDKLMNLVGEMVIARNQVMQYSSTLEDNAFVGTVQRLNLLTTELQVNVMKTRMQPIGNVWSKFPRVVRDMAIVCGKKVRYEMEGQETELDKTIIEAIRDPLTHMVRNAVDHGIEKPDVRTRHGKPPEGKLHLHAFHEGGKVIIEIIDDGGGIDPQRVRSKAIASKLITVEESSRMTDRELINLVFLPGFSTTDKVTNFSGRGVGMDVVRTNIEKIGGTVEIDSRLGHGTQVKLKIPLTLAIIPALTITSGGDRYAIPQVNLLELLRLEGEQIANRIEQIHGFPVYRLRGNLLPLVYLNEQLRIDAPKHAPGEINIVVLQADERQFGLVVDAIHDTEEIVVKPLQKHLKSIDVFAGATIMGDGRVALILDILGIAQRANVVSATRGRALADKATVAVNDAVAELHSLLICTIEGGGRIAIPLAMVARLEEFPVYLVERAGSRRVVQYRGTILHLLDVARELRKLQRKTDGTTRRRRKPPTDIPVSFEMGEVPTTHVVVYAGAGGQVGLVVESILDIVEDEVAIQSQANRLGVLFTAVVHGRVTEFLNVEELIQTSQLTSGSHSAKESA